MANNLFSRYRPRNTANLINLHRYKRLPCTVSSARTNNKMMTKGKKAFLRKCWLMRNPITILCACLINIYQIDITKKATPRSLWRYEQIWVDISHTKAQLRYTSSSETRKNTNHDSKTDQSMRQIELYGLESRWSGYWLELEMTEKVRAIRLIGRDRPNFLMVWTKKVNAKVSGIKMRISTKTWRIMSSFENIQRFRSRRMKKFPNRIEPTVISTGTSVWTYFSNICAWSPSWKQY
jgi:hypothetical protein